MTTADIAELERLEKFLMDAPWEVKESDAGLSIGTAGEEDGPGNHPEIEELETRERLQAWATIRNALPELIRLAKDTSAAVEAEREACAEMADDEAREYGTAHQDSMRDLAKRIRARAAPSGREGE